MNLAAANNLVRQAANETSGDLTRSLLRKAAELCSGTESSEEASVLLARVYSLLALEDITADSRASHWRKCIQTIKRQVSSDPSPIAADTYAMLAVDCFQDRFSSLGTTERQQTLRNSLNELDKALKRRDDHFGQLLSRKSAILRHAALTEILPGEQRSRLEQAKRCAELAHKHVATSSFAQLELGLCEWALSRIAETDQEAADRLRSAEAIFLRDDIQSTEVGRLTLVRFFRLSYKALDACTHFPTATQAMESLRRVLRESYLYAEAATQLWFNDYPEATYLGHLKAARRLLETALAAGYHNARLVTDLAFVTAILDGPPGGETVLKDIRRGSSLDWSEVARVAAQVDSVDLISEGFALGMNQSAIWTRLGTFARRFIGDDKLSEVLHRAAVSLNPHDAIALTNLARQLARTSDAAALNDAERLLSKAQSFADRRFFWWRHVLAEVHDKKGIKRAQPVKSSPLPERPSPASTIHQIRQRFRSLQAMSDVHHRGLELERLVFDLSSFTYGVSSPAYKISREQSGVIRQIDGFFEHGPDPYRVECKWLSEPVGQNEIVLFYNKLDVSGVSGLFISISGFKDTAINQAREYKSSRPILLMDGEEASAVFNGYIRFDEVITRKRQGLHQLSDPYYRIMPRGEVA
jgi:hypothetical protein